MTTGPDMWVGADENSGLPSLDRPDAPRSRWSWEALAAVELPHHHSISPDGSTVAFVNHLDTSDIWTVPVEGGPSRRLTTDRGVMIYWWDVPPAWSPDGTRIAYTREGEVRVITVEDGRSRAVTEAGSPRWVDDTTLLVTIERDQESRLAIVDVDDPWPRALTPPGHDVGEFRVAGSGGLAVYVRSRSDDRKASEIWMVGLPGGECRQLTGEPGMHDLSPALSPDGKTLAFTSERDGWYHLYTVDLETGHLDRLADDDGDFSALDWNSDGHRLVATRGRRGRHDLVTVEFPGGTTRRVAEGGWWSSPRWAGDRIVASYEDHRTPPKLVVIEPDSTIRPLTGPPPAQVASGPYVGFEEVTYRSFDGLEIHGFLFRPDTESSRAPAIVYPHGGPIDAYGDAWHGEAQFFIDKGYAWFGINFRGSNTYGRDFERANHGVWGVDDTEDCLAAADFLAGLPWVDPERIAIFGSSYGAYMALTSMVADSERRFACAVLKAGDSEMARSWARCERTTRQELEMMMGTPAEAGKAYREGSPLWRVDAIDGPLLVATGEQDDIVPWQQSAELVAELRRLGSQFEYLTYPTEAHGLMRSGPYLHFYRRLERFLDWHLM